MMPRLSGWEFLAELRGAPELARLPVLVTSVFTPAPGLLSPRDAYLSKPYLAESLAAAVRRLVAARS